MDVDPYRLAYNVFHCNWKKFGIPPEEIPPPYTEKVNSLDPIIPGFSKAVVLFQIASRKDLKKFLDNECPIVRNESDVYERFKKTMKEALPKYSLVIDLPSDNVNENVSVYAMNEDVSQDTMEDLSEDSMETDLPEDAMKEDLSEDAMKEDLPEDAMKEGVSVGAMKEGVSVGAMKEGVSVDAMKEGLSVDAMKEGLSVDAMKEGLSVDAVKEGVSVDAMREGLSENAMKEDLSGNTVRSEDIPGLIAYSLAVCTELVLYERENENNKDHMKCMPDMWKNYFDKHLKSLCEEARCNQDDLKAYSNSIKCPEKFLNKFITENKNEYNEIADKFYDYTEKYYAEESSESSKSITEVRNFPKGLSFLKMKETCTAIIEIFKCPCSASSTSTTPST